VSKGSGSGNLSEVLERGHQGLKVLDSRHEAVEHIDGELFEFSETVIRVPDNFLYVFKALRAGSVRPHSAGAPWWQAYAL
jgi:hypothetical protein